MPVNQNYQPIQQTESSRKVIALALGILGGLTLLGFAGYYFGFLGFIYNVMMPGTLGRFPLVFLAVIFGVAAFFSPCSFSVLPAYVAHYLTGSSSATVPSETSSQSHRFMRGLHFGAIAALGILTVNLVLGLVIAILGSAAPFAKDPREDIALILGVRVVAGLLIAYLGVLAFLDRPLEIPFVERFVSRWRSDFKKNTFLYGLLYNGAAIGCTGPILLGLVLYAFSLGSFTSALLAFVIFALTMALLMIAFTTLITVFTETITRRLMPVLPTIKRVAGSVMVLAGIAIALFTLEGNRIFVKIFFPFLK